MVTIEEFKQEYMRDLYSISAATGHMGGDASHLYINPELMGLIYSAPYAVLEPSLVLLALDEQGVAGFALGVLDTASWEDRLEQEWWPALRAKYPDPSTPLVSEWTPDQRRAHMIHHPARVPQEIRRPYPAHLHVNLLPRIQGTGVGPRLLQAWLEHAELRDTQGVHVGVNRHNERAIRFWDRAGFAQLALMNPEPGRTVWMGKDLVSRHGKSPWG
jgi:GNAT superfamily N-acetyltransferase